MSVRIAISHAMGGQTLDLTCELGDGLSAIFGPSGAGKTTILRIIAGLLTPAQGKIEIAGRLLLDTGAGIDLAPPARGIGYVFQEPRLFPHLSVAQNLRYGMGRRGPATLPLGFEAMVDLLGLRDLLTRRPATLSGGEGQRVALGRALLSGPELLLMDEPLSAIDQARKLDLLPYFEKIRDTTGIPILYVSHDIDEVARLADRVILLDHGQVQAIGTAAEVLAGGQTGDPISRDIAGGLLTVEVTGIDEADGLTETRIGDQVFWLPGRAGAPGDLLRVRVDARDVILMSEAPRGISALNALPVQVLDIQDGPGSGALVRLDHQGQRLVARITRRSVRALNLEPGLKLHAVIKSMAVQPGQVTQR